MWQYTLLMGRWCQTFTDGDFPGWLMVLPSDAVVFSHYEYIQRRLFKHQRLMVLKWVQRGQMYYNLHSMVTFLQCMVLGWPKRRVPIGCLMSLGNTVGLFQRNVTIQGDTWVEKCCCYMLSINDVTGEEGQPKKSQTWRHTFEISFGKGQHKEKT